MKKVFFVAVAAVALLCCSCSADQCKCTTKSEKSTSTNIIEKDEDKKCSDYNSDGKTSVGGISIDLNTTVKCVNYYGD